MDPVQAVDGLALIAGGLPLQTVAGYSQTLILGLLALLVLPVITILFVGHLVRSETIDEERMQRLESEVAHLRDEIGADDGDYRAE